MHTNSWVLLIATLKSRKDNDVLKLFALEKMKISCFD